MDRYEALVRLSQLAPNITLRSAIEYVGAVVSNVAVPAGWWLTHEGRVAFARCSPEITSLLPARKIQAIKVLREEISKVTDVREHYSLLACKNVIDELSY